MDKVLSLINQQIDKAKDIRYFIFFATFILFFDVFICVTKNISVLEFTISFDFKKLAIGEILIFTLSFSFFISCIVPVIKIFLIIIGLLIKPVCRDYLSFNRKLDNVKLKDKIRIERMKWFSVKNKNSIAYNFAMENQSKRDKVRQLRFACLSFIVITIINYFLTDIGVVKYVFLWLCDSDESIFKSLGTISILFLYFFAFYMGVISDGRLNYDYLDDDYIFFPDHNM